MSLMALFCAFSTVNLGCSTESRNIKKVFFPSLCKTSLTRTLQENDQAIDKRFDYKCLLKGKNEIVARGKCIHFK